MIIQKMKKIHSLLFVFLFTSPLLWAQSRFYQQLADSASTLQHQKVTYDPAYFTIDYPNGDVPKDKGVCTDVVIRAYRMFDTDLQKLVHEDMTKNFNQYPNNWGLTQPDKNIDHRRVPNLMIFFKKYGKELPVTQNPKDYKPGDIVTWVLGNGITHIGMVTRHKSPDKKRPLIMHNIGAGQVLEDMLFDFEITGHYRYQEK